MKLIAQLFLPALACSAAAAAQNPPETVFRTDVRMVHLLVTVQDETRAPVGGLRKADFSISDGGAPREIAVFERRTNRPLLVGLVMDASLSTAIELTYERESAKRFLDNLLGAGSNPDDRAAVFTFSEGVEMLTGFTRSKKRLRRAVERAKPESGTSLYDAVLLGAEELSYRKGRRVLILISDGGDTTSYSTFRQALEAAHAADCVIYGLTVLPIKADAGRNVGGENALKMMTESTGGDSFVEYGAEALDRAFDEILRNLRTQYLLAYYPPPPDKKSSRRFRPIEVSVSLPGVRVLTRDGYYVPEQKRILPESVAPRRVSVRPAARRETAKPAPAEEKKKP